MKIYEAENLWWYLFFQSLGISNYDVEYADHLRQNGVLPQIAVEETKI